VLRNKPAISTLSERLRNRRRIANIEEEFCDRLSLNSSVFRAEFCHVEHHLAHLASSFFVSPFQQAALISVDGFGDFASTMLAMGDGHQIEELAKVYFPHSLGLFYLAVTQYLGFLNYGDEYKVMGLAPYGKPTYLEHMRQIVNITDDGLFSLKLDNFTHHNNGFEMRWENTVPSLGKVFSPAMENLLGPARKPADEISQRHKDIAASLQASYEEAFFCLLNRLFDLTGAESLCVAGGCGMNSVANGKIFERTPFKDVFIQPAAGDAGGAIGAAIYTYNSRLAHGQRRVFENSYLGPAYDNAGIARLISQHQEALTAAGCTVQHLSDENALCEITAKAVAEGKVAGWFQGRMEWGPRALGNRSIICDPRNPHMKQILNEKIKRRESFRPFAPAIQREAVSRYFETDYDVPYMLQVFKVRNEVRELIPAVTHVDGSGRLQTVTREQNQRFWKLIDEFRKVTGVPILLNTSFNENEPIVCKPDEALDCFLRTRMDVLVLNDYLIRRMEKE
jgi:carbamoyltransferase